MKYTPAWDLSTIPDAPFASEAGRRRRAKGPKRTYVKMKKCAGDGCTLLRTATERRDIPCPFCGTKEERKKASE